MLCAHIWGNEHVRGRPTCTVAGSCEVHDSDLLEYSPLQPRSNINLSSYHSVLLPTLNINVFLMNIILRLALEGAITRLYVPKPFGVGGYFSSAALDNRPAVCVPFTLHMLRSRTSLKFQSY